MKLAIALVLVFAFPAVASAQYGLQLRPSPYRILSGSEQNANTYRTQSVEGVTRAAAPLSERTQDGQAGIQPNSRDSDVTGSTPAPR